MIVVVVVGHHLFGRRRLPAAVIAAPVVVAVAFVESLSRLSPRSRGRVVVVIAVAVPVVIVFVAVSSRWSSRRHHCRRRDRRHHGVEVAVVGQDGVGGSIRGRRGRCGGMPRVVWQLAP